MPTCIANECKTSAIRSARGAQGKKEKNTRRREESKRASERNAIGKAKEVQRENERGAASR